MHLVTVRLLTSEEMGEVVEWLRQNNVDILKLRRDFSDVWPLAVLLEPVYPRLINMINYPKRNRIALKMENWETFNFKVLSKLNLRLGKAFLEQLAKGTIGMIEVLIYELIRVEKRQRLDVERQRLAVERQRLAKERQAALWRQACGVGVVITEILEKNDEGQAVDQKNDEGQAVDQNDEGQVVDQNDIEPNTIDQNDIEPNTRDQNEIESDTRDQNEIESDTMDQNEIEPNTMDQNDIEPDTMDQNEIEPDTIDQNDIEQEHSTIDQNDNEPNIMEVSQAAEEAGGKIVMVQKQVGDDIVQVPLKMIPYSRFERISREFQAKDAIIEMYQNRLTHLEDMVQAKTDKINEMLALLDDLPSQPSSGQ